MCHPARKSGGKGIAVLKRKFFSNNNLNARRGLEPHFRVLFSAIFHGVSLGISTRVENYGIERKENCSQSTYKIFGCVFEISYLNEHGALSGAQRLGALYSPSKTALNAITLAFPL